MIGYSLAFGPIVGAYSSDRAPEERTIGGGGVKRPGETPGSRYYVHQIAMCLSAKAKPAVRIGTIKPI